MSEDKKKNNEKLKTEFKEDILKEFPEGLFEEPEIPDYDPMTVSLWDVVNTNGILPRVISGIRDPELRENMEAYMYGLIATYQQTLDKGREHLKDPETFNKVVEAL